MNSDAYRGEKRPADVIGAAVKVMRVAAGEEPEDIDPPESQRKHPAAVSLGKRGAAAKRWKKPK